jgi:hypothetical protein
MKELAAFIKGHCANWSTTCRMCFAGTFNEGPCLVLKGQPCKYFEKSVFPICDPNYKFSDRSLKYKDISYQYGNISGNIGAWNLKDVRMCPCGNSKPLQYRHRLCDACAKKSQKKSVAKWRKKQR